MCVSTEIKLRQNIICIADNLNNLSFDKNTTRNV